jgi:hypothetical protein
MILELSDEQAAALEKELTAIIDGHRYFLSPRIQILREIRNMIRPEPKREPLPEPKRYEPPPINRGRAAAGLTEAKAAMSSLRGTEWIAVISLSWGHSSPQSLAL